MTVNKKIRLIAYYLPQYHPIPENNSWWGSGFTEWINVVKAKPLFRGHYQPHIPADLGFYDLRVPETRAAQAEMAQNYRIEGFCYWHYWLGNGRMLLQRPFEEVLKSGEPNFPFCLGWANHSWTGIWFGAPNRTLAKQTYPGMEDHRKHFYYLLKAFKDPRYITVEKKPLLHIFRPYEIPDPKRVMDYWRELALKAGIKGLHIVGDGVEPDELEDFGLDACTYSNHRLIEDPYLAKYIFLRRLLRKYRNKFHKPQVFSYKKAMNLFIRKGDRPNTEYPAIIPNWDSTPRLGWQGIVLHNSDPELFRIHVREVKSQMKTRPIERKIVFIKSWNEWAEGNHLEPDQKYGKAYLNVLKDEFLQATQNNHNFLEWGNL